MRPYFEAAIFVLVAFLLCPWIERWFESYYDWVGRLFERRE